MMLIGYSLIWMVNPDKAKIDSAKREVDPCWRHDLIFAPRPAPPPIVLEREANVLYGLDVSSEKDKMLRSPRRLHHMLGAGSRFWELGVVGEKKKAR